MKPIAKARIEKELKMFASSPSPGISCSCKNDSLQNLSGVIIGAPGTPFENGLFTLDITIPDRYPFDPPCMQFVTPVYHPNIDSQGRICLDTLKLPPQGSWKPQLNLSTVLMMIRVLLGEPGKEDPLMANIWQEYKYDYPTYAAKAKQWTMKYAREGMPRIDQNVSNDKKSDIKDSGQQHQEIKSRTNSNSDYELEGEKSNKTVADNNIVSSSSSSSSLLSASSLKSSSVLHDDTNIQKGPPRKRILGLKTSKKTADVATVTSHDDDVVVKKKTRVDS